MSLTARSPTGRKRKSWLNRTLVVWREAVGIDDCCAVLAFANIAAVAERLAECEPALTGEAVLDDGGPKDQHVDPGIAALGRRVLRHGDRSFRRGGSPRLNP